MTIPRRICSLAAALALATAAEPLGAQVERSFVESVYTLRDSLARRGPFTHPVELPAACPAAELWNHLEWQWRRMPGEVLADVWRLSGGEEEKAFARIRDRESREPEVAELYGKCHAASPAAFWYLVVTASAADRRTVDDCREHVDWQHGRFRGTVRTAARWFDGRERGRAKTELAPWVAMAALLGGQQHNDRAMALYRGCFRDDPSGLREYVARKSR